VVPIGKCLGGFGKCVSLTTTLVSRLLLRCWSTFRSRVKTCVSRRSQMLSLRRAQKHEFLLSPTPRCLKCVGIVISGYDMPPISKPHQPLRGTQESARSGKLRTTEQIKQAPDRVLFLAVKINQTAKTGEMEQWAPTDCHEKIVGGSENAVGGVFKDERGKRSRCCFSILKKRKKKSECITHRTSNKLLRGRTGSNQNSCRSRSFVASPARIPGGFR
jgi:hypothetical protein